MKRRGYEEECKLVIKSISKELEEAIKVNKLSNKLIGYKMRTEGSNISRIRLRLARGDTNIRMSILLRILCVVHNTEDYTIKMTLAPEGGVTNVVGLANLRANKISVHDFARRTGFTEWRTSLWARERSWKDNPGTSMFIAYFAYCKYLGVKWLKFSKQDIEKTIACNEVKRERYRVDLDGITTFREKGRSIRIEAENIVKEIANKLVTDFRDYMTKHASKLKYVDVDKMMSRPRGSTATSLSNLSLGDVKTYASTILVLQHSLDKISKDKAEHEHIIVPINYSKEEVPTLPYEIPVTIEELLTIRKSKFTELEMSKLCGIARDRLVALEENWLRDEFRFGFIYYIIYGLALGCRALDVSNARVMKYLLRDSVSEIKENE